MASASNWDAARRRVDRRRETGVRPAAEVAKSQPCPVHRSRQRAVAAAVQPVFSQDLPEPADPADRVRTDRAKCRAVSGLWPRGRDRNAAERRARRQGPASRAKISRRTVSADLAEAGTGQRERAAAE